MNRYGEIYADSEIWLPGIAEIASRHGLSGRPVRQALGSHVVYEVGGAIVKLFCPLWLMDYQAERNALRAISGVPVPEILEEGCLEGWPYLILSKVDGIPAGEIWDSLDAGVHRNILTQLGHMMRTLHEQTRSIPDGFTDTWDAFLRARIAGVLLHHGMPDPWPEWITRYLGRFEEPEMGRVLVNGDITEDHVLLSEGDLGWEISGLIDFGDARIGHPLYEFIAPLAFYAFGEPESVLALVEAYGLGSTPELQDRLTTYCLLHEFGHIRDFRKRHPVELPVDFVRALWGTADVSGTTARP